MIIIKKKINLNFQLTNKFFPREHLFPVGGFLEENKSHAIFESFNALFNASNF